MVRSIFLCTLLCLISLSIEPQQVDALSCWSCSSLTTQSCNDPFNREDPHSLYENCDLSGIPSPVCTTVRKLGGVVIRSCSPSYNSPCTMNSFSPNQFDNSVNPFNTNGQNNNNGILLDFQECLTCTFDGCNGAIMKTSMTLMILMPLVVSILLSI